MAYSNQASDMVYDYIIEKIKNKIWLAGEKISTEAQLCEELGVSRIAVRQAIEKLSALSLLKKKQGSGTYVSEFEDSFLLGMPFYASTKENAITILEFRRMFDSYNAELFVSKCNETDIISLEMNYENMKNSFSNMKEFRYYDNEFHDLIAKGTRNAIIIQISNVFMDVLRDLQTTLYQNVGPEDAIEYHGMILGSIKNKNAELASIYSRMHIENSLRQMYKKMNVETVKA